MKRIILAALVGVLVSGPVWGANAGENLSQTEKLAFANWHHEMVECHVYYLIAAQLFQNEPNPNKEVIEKLEQVTNTLLERIKVLGRAIGMLDEAAAAAMRLAYRQQLQEINNDFTLNSAILAEKYANLCKVVVENSDTRIKHWMNEATKEP